MKKILLTAKTRTFHQIKSFFRRSNKPRIEGPILSEMEKRVAPVFKQNPKLAEIGTHVEYASYLETVFPESIVKNICFHQTFRAFKEFEADRSRTGGIYFSPFNLIGMPMIMGRGYGIIRNYTIIALLDIRKPLKITKKENSKLRVDNIKWLSKKIDLTRYDAVVGFSNIFYDKGQLDSDIINVGPSWKNNIEFVVFKPEQIHRLGSDKDIENFTKWKNHV